MAKPGEMVSSGKTAGTGTDDEDTTAAVCRGPRKLPLVFDRHVAEKTLDCMDTDRTVDKGSIAGRLTKVITDAAVDCGERVVFD